MRVPASGNSRRPSEPVQSHSSRRHSCSILTCNTNFLRTPTVARTVASARPGIADLPSGMCLGNLRIVGKDVPSFCREASVASVFTGRWICDRCATDVCMRQVTFIRNVCRVVCQGHEYPTNHRNLRIAERVAANLPVYALFFVRQTCCSAIS